MNVKNISPGVYLKPNIPTLNLLNTYILVFKKVKISSIFDRNLKIGTYNPNTNPATIDLKFDRALYWLMTGAQPTDTASRILSYKGVLLKKHLLEGVKKGAFDEAAAEAKFEAWMKEKEAKIQAKIQKLAQAGDAAAKAALEAEAKVRAAKEEIIAKKKAELAAAEAAKKAEEEAAAAPEEAAAEAPAAE